MLHLAIIQAGPITTAMRQHSSVHLRLCGAADDPPRTTASKKQTGRLGRPVLRSLTRFLLALRVNHELDLCTLRIDDRHTVLRGEVLVAADLWDLLHNNVWEAF